MSWLAAKSLFGAPRWLLLALVAMAITAATAVALGAFDHALDRAEQAGVTKERAQGLGEVLRRTQEANDVREQIENEAAAGSGHALYDECVRGNRGGPEACQRFLPQ